MHLMMTVLLTHLLNVDQVLVLSICITRETESDSLKHGYLLVADGPLLEP